MLLQRGWKIGVATFAILAVAAGAHAETLRFQFKKPADAHDWKPLKGKWVVAERGYQPKRVDGMLSHAMTIVDKEKISDATLKAQIIGAKNRNFGAALWARLSYTKEDGDYIVSGYHFSLYLVSDDKLYVSATRFDRLNINNPFATSRKELCEGSIANFKGNIIEPQIELHGSSMKIVIDGKTICTGRDKTYKSGSVGYMTQDNFRTPVFVWLKSMEIKTSN